MYHTYSSKGEFETTLLNTFISNARLRQWMSRPDVPAAVKNCASLFNRLFGNLSYTRGEEEELDDGVDGENTIARVVRVLSMSFDTVNLRCQRNVK